MKTAIVTFVRAYNHGAILQTYALHKKLLDFGIDNEVLDYYPKYFFDLYMLKQYGDARYLPYRPLSNWWGFLPLVRNISRRADNFDRFIKQNIKLSDNQFTAPEQIDNTVLPYDAYVCGSDQVWNYFITDFDPIFSLDFSSAKKAKRYSYAASFGSNSIKDEHTEQYKKLLDGWDTYCVREASGIDIIKQLTEKDAIQCCDPTLLLTKSEWEKVCAKKKPSKPYILLYYVNTSEQLFPVAQKLAKEKGLDVFVINSNQTYEGLLGKTAKSLGFTQLNCSAPDDFLAYISNAEYVLTDSFHGTVFSLIFHRRFLSQTEYKWGGNSRISALLKLSGTESRTLAADISEIDKSIDWDFVEAEFAKLRNSSFEYIKSLS